MKIQKIIDELEERTQSRFAHIRRYLASHKFDLENWEWLEQFTREGEGIDICAGDFPIGGAYGVDGIFCLSTIEGLPFSDPYHFPQLEDNTVDYVVTNYFDGLECPLKALKEWRRVMKPEGKLGIVCRDAYAYDDPVGPLRNKNRLSSFVLWTLENYITRAGFREVIVIRNNGVLQASAIK